VGILTFLKVIDMGLRTDEKTARDACAGNYLFTWKPGERWPHESLRKFVSEFKASGSAEVDWTCAAFKQVRPGDRAYLLKQGKPPRGIFGRGRVVGKPYPKQMAAPHTGKWLVDLSFDVDKGDILCDPEDRLLVPEEKLLQLAPKSQWQNQSAGISVSEGAARKLDDLINAFGSVAVWNQQRELGEAVVDLAEQMGQSRVPGQGFLISPTVRKAIEEHSVKLAAAYYAERGYTVRAVGKPYDLHCTRNGSQIFVEVKGTQNSGEEVLLTPNEVKFARQNKIEMALFVVHGIEVDTQTEPPAVSGGSTTIYEAWDVERGELVPLGYCLKIAKQPLAKP
jgi:hypothetical protein